MERAVSDTGDEHGAAQSRARELPTRLGVALFLFVSTWALTRSEWSVAWLAAVGLGQAVDWLIFRPLRGDPQASPSASRKAACTASVAVNAVIYSGFAPLLWMMGGEGGQVFAIMVLCGSLLHVTLKTQQMPRLLLASVIPMSVYFFGLPIASWIAAPRAAATPSLIMIVAGVIYLAHLAHCVRQTSRATAALIEAKALAEAQGRRAEQEREVAARANAAKSDFLATISHEIRTPMNAVISAGHLLERTSLSPEQSECVSILLNGGEMLMGLVNDVLDLSKIDAGKMILEDAELDLRSALIALVELWKPGAEAKGLSLRADLASNLPSVVRTDPLRLKQILFNLLSNAVKFTEHSEVVLSAGLSAGPQGEGMLWFEVSDTGCGIAPDAVERLFQGFEQADAGTTRRHGGTGLGLSISHRLAQLMGGQLTATSIAGVGSRFRADLPLRLATASGLAPASQAPAPAPPSNLSLLVAEDHPVNRRVIALLLEPVGWRLTFAENGARAFEIAGREPFDAILMDMHMPEMDGLQATRAIRASAGPNRTTPILALTANALDHHRKAWSDIGVDSFLSKPINLDELIAAVATACAPATSSDPELAAGAPRQAEAVKIGAQI